MVIVSGEDELENKYRRSVLDIAILQDHIGEQHRSFPPMTRGRPLQSTVIQGIHSAMI